jgi:hypothetical protein
VVAPKPLGKDRLVVWHHSANLPAAYFISCPTNYGPVVRVQVRVPGFRTRSVLLVTTLLDPVQYPPQALAQLYRRRWEMELCFRHLKTTLQMEHLSCKSPAMIDRNYACIFCPTIWSPSRGPWVTPSGRCSGLVAGPQRHTLPSVGSSARRQRIRTTLPNPGFRLSAERPVDANPEPSNGAEPYPRLTAHAAVQEILTESRYRRPAIANSLRLN